MKIYKSDEGAGGRLTTLHTGKVRGELQVISNLPWYCLDTTSPNFIVASVEDARDG
jgi:hypothetical protein